MWKYIDELKGIHKGHDIYIIGSGPSLQYYEPSFFLNKICIGINYAHKFVQCEYTVQKDIVTQRQFDEVCDSIKYGTLITTEFYHELDTNELIDHKYNTEKTYYICPIAPNKGTLDMDYFGTDTMVQSHMTVTTVVNIAYYLGAANIILVGIDGGLLDNKTNIEGYYEQPTDEQKKHFAKSYSHPYAETDLRRLRDELKKRNCSMVSLHPFIGLGREGHKFQKYPISEGELWRGKYE